MTVQTCPKCRVIFNDEDHDKDCPHTYHEPGDEKE